MSKKPAKALYRKGKLYEIREVQRSERKRDGTHRIKCRGVGTFDGGVVIVFSPTKGYARATRREL